MGSPVLIIGDSGKEKSVFLDSFQPEKVEVIDAKSRLLSIRDQLETIKIDSGMTVEAVLKKAKAKFVIIDDVQYLMAKEFMHNAKANTYQKFTDIALNFWALVQAVINDLPGDMIVYFLSHLRQDNDGREKMKVVGRMLEEKITVEDMFTIILKVVSHNDGYHFRIHSNSGDATKIPIGMFETDEIESSLKMVDEVIRNGYEVGGKKTSGRN